MVAGARSPSPAPGSTALLLGPTCAMNIVAQSGCLKRDAVGVDRRRPIQCLAGVDNITAQQFNIEFLSLACTGEAK